MTPRYTTEWVSQSADGYYRVYSERGCFGAYHVMALWAKPTNIGTASSLTAAQYICNEHAERTPAPV
jgi:hypothetical protein